MTKIEGRGTFDLCVPENMMADADIVLSERARLAKGFQEDKKLALREGMAESTRRARRRLAPSSRP